MSIGILMPLLAVLALILYALDSVKGMLFWKIYAKMGGTRPQNDIAGKSPHRHCTHQDSAHIKCIEVTLSKLDSHVVI
jgi:hypothetical protein